MQERGDFGHFRSFPYQKKISVNTLTSAHIPVKGFSVRRVSNNFYPYADTNWISC